MDGSPINFPFASNEHARLREMREVIGPRRDTDPFLQQIAERARLLFDSPTAHVSVVEADHQWFLAKVGIDLESTPRDYALSSHTIMSDQPLILPDTRDHQEFAAHPGVVLGPKVRFYAGAPIVLTSGFRVGSVCVIDVEPHDTPSIEAVHELIELAADVAQHLESKHAQRRAGNQDERERIASDAQKEFLALIGHELRTPLTILLGNSKLLFPRLSGDIERRMCKAITASGEHLNQLIKHIMHYSDLASGELFLAEENSVCTDILQSAAMMVEPIANASDRTIETSCAEEVSTVRADSEQICVALSALITNAVKHGKGTVEVAARRGSDGTLRLTVYDHGPGLDQDHIERADRPFTIGGDLDTRKASGLGLGLPLAKKIVELHSGTLLSGRENDRALVELQLPGWRCGPPIR